MSTFTDEASHHYSEIVRLIRIIPNEVDLLGLLFVDFTPGLPAVPLRGGVRKVCNDLTSPGRKDAAFTPVEGGVLGARPS